MSHCECDDCRLQRAAPALLAACKAQHAAIDTLFVMLIERDKSFMPSKSPAWPACVLGHEAIALAEALPARAPKASDIT